MAQRQRDFPNAQRRAKRLRKTRTPAEEKFWDLLRKIDGYHWRDQVPLGPHTYDFAEMSQRLLIELDGGIHDLPEVQARDRLKESWAIS